MKFLLNSIEKLFMALFSTQKSLKRFNIAFLSILLVCGLFSVFCDFHMVEKAHDLSSAPWTQGEEQQSSTLMVCCESKLETSNTKTILSAISQIEKFAPAVLLVLTFALFLTLREKAWTFSSTPPFLRSLSTPTDQKVLLRL